MYLYICKFTHNTYIYIDMHIHRKWKKICEYSLSPLQWIFLCVIVDTCFLSVTSVSNETNDWSLECTLFQFPPYIHFKPYTHLSFLNLYITGHCHSSNICNREFVTGPQVCRSNLKTRINDVGLLESSAILAL